MTDARCRGCKAPIRWVRLRGPDGTVAGTSHPIDPDPVDDGTILLEDRFFPNGTQIGAIAARPPLAGQLTLAGDIAEAAPRYRSHYATCPRAQDFR